MTDVLEESAALGELVARDTQGFLALVRREVSLACIQGKKQAGLVELDGRRAYFKLGPLRGKSRLRHALRARLLGLSYPALAEFDNLTWLRRNGFGAPLPLAAGVFRRGSLPLFQFLYTEEVPGARDLGSLGGEETREDLGPVLRALGRDLARLHARGFVHRDLFPRNVLVTGGAREPAVHFLDCRRGGARPGLRGPSHDLACLMVRAGELFGEDDQVDFFEAYCAERERQGRPFRTKTLASVRRQRNRLARRERRRKDAPPPPPDWVPPRIPGA